MKTLISALAVTIFFGMALPPARGQDSISVDFFYENLSPHGNWLEAGDYGYVWQPRDTRDDWRPYSDGRWVYTDAGWTWDSAEPYGWAVYHYGRWANMRDVGWVWVPGTEWGPAWVSWRRSPDYVGWAPLPPEARFSNSIGFSSWVDDYYDIGPGSYRFVEGRNFGARRLNSVFVDQRQNVTIINQSTNITNITYRDNIIYNGGPDYDEVVRRSSEPISRYRLDRRRDIDGRAGREQAGYFQSRVEGDSYSVVSPRMREGSGGKPAKLSRTVRDAEVDRGWRDLENPDEIERVRAKMKSDTPVPAALPKRAENTKRPGRGAAEAKGGNADRPGPAGNQNKGEGKGNNAKGMRNRQPETGAPRPNREAAGKGMTEKGESKPSPGAPRPNREAAGKGKTEKGEGRPSPEAPRPNREAAGKGAPGKGEGRPSPGSQSKGKGTESESKPESAPRPNRMPVEAPAPGNGGKGGKDGKGNAEKENRPSNPAAREKGRTNENSGRKQEEGRPSPGRKGSEKDARPEPEVPAPSSRPASGREIMQPEGRGAGAGEAGGNRAPANPARAGGKEKDRPANGKTREERARENEKEKEKAKRTGTENEEDNKVN